MNLFCDTLYFLSMTLLEKRWAKVRECNIAETLYKFALQIFLYSEIFSTANLTNLEDIYIVWNNKSSI